MLIENAKIIAIEPDMLWLEVVKHTACGGCEAKSNCGNGVLERWFARPLFIPVKLEASDSYLHYYVSQLIRVGVQENALVKAAFIAYFIPCVLMVLGVLLGGWLSTQLMDVIAIFKYHDLVSFLGGVVGLVLMFVLRGIRSVFAKNKHDFPLGFQNVGRDIVGVRPIILKPTEAQPVIIRER